MENEERVDLFQYYRKNGKHSLASLYLLPSLMLDPKLTNWETLNKMGYLSLFLYDKTEGFAEYYPNSLLMVYNPSVSFYENHWEDFSKLMKTYNNFICENYYDKYVYAFWFKINPVFGQDLRLLFKQGKYSQFPKNYIAYLSELQQKICKKDIKYREYLENKLGLLEDTLENCELETKEDLENLNFKYIKTI